jgi:hypothetical protein
MRKPRDIDAELKQLLERTRELKTKRTAQLGELVEATGADTLPLETLTGILLDGTEQARANPEALARWSARGQAFFQTGKRPQGDRGKGATGAEGIAGTAPGTPGLESPAEESRSPHR